jgi:RNA polymerase sigma factor (sigma-70 family)
MSFHSVSQWIAGLKDGDALAVQNLWTRYFERLVRLAKKKLGNSPKRVADEDDIAQNVFHSLCRGAKAGRFSDVSRRDDLWWLLLGITRQKVADYVRKETAQKRGPSQVQTEGGLNPRESQPFMLDQLLGDEPSPEFLAILNEQNEHLLNLLRDDQLRRIAMWRIEGYTVEEIANLLAVSDRTIERKLRLIRNSWSKELGNVE